MTRLKVGLMPASRNFAMRDLKKGYTLKKPIKIPTMEPMADRMYATICIVVTPWTWLIEVGVEVPAGQLWEGEQRRQVDSEV